MDVRTMWKKHPTARMVIGILLIGAWLWLSMAVIEPALGVSKASAAPQTTTASAPTYGAPGCRGGFCRGIHAPSAENLYQDPRAGRVMIRCGGATAFGAFAGGVKGALGASGTCLWLSMDW